MNELRELRRAAGLKQWEFAVALSVPLETLRTWDSGRRVVPSAVLQRARTAVAHHRRQEESLSLAELARELGVHVRTLQAAARTGRLQAHFSVRSIFGRPIRSASRATGQQFLARHYRCFSGQELCPAPLPTVPDEYDKRLRAVRRRRVLTQDALARSIGAAGKAVVYQWESRKRTPSPVLWQRDLELDGQPAPR
jgi:DNA-binding transcriptional regulator YiaG